jgi:hypothetical protein
MTQATFIIESQSAGRNTSKKTKKESNLAKLKKNINESDRLLTVLF